MIIIAIFNHNGPVSLHQQVKGQVQGNANSCVMTAAFIKRTVTCGLPVFKPENQSKVPAILAFFTILGPFDVEETIKSAAAAY